MRGACGAHSSVVRLREESLAWSILIIPMEESSCAEIVDGSIQTEAGSPDPG